MSAARRFDLAIGSALFLDRSHRRHDGQPLIIPGRAARTGVQRYGAVAEYRPPEEVFHADSIASLIGAGITVGHVERLTWDTRHEAVGCVRTARRDGNHIGVELVVWDRTTIEAILRGDLAELSCGYDVELDPTSGVTPQGERYDAIQRKIRHNHLAIGGRGWARCGTSCSVAA
jgi:uncharacterized protein